jgi:hypothetical protein
VARRALPAAFLMPIREEEAAEGWVRAVTRVRVLIQGTGAAEGRVQAVRQARALVPERRALAEAAALSPAQLPMRM